MAMFEKEQARFEFKPLGVRDIPNGRAVLDTAWQFGYLPNLSVANKSPYGLSCFKLWSMGEIHVVMVSIDELSKHPSWAIIEQMRLGLLETTMPEVKKFIETGIKIYAATITPNSLLYIPTGFLLAEHCHQGPLLYGVRKTMCFSTEPTIARFLNLIDTEKKNGKETTKTEKLLESIKKVKPVSQAAASSA